MQTQEVPTIKKYIDRDSYAKLSHSCEVWYYLYAGGINQVIYSNEHKVVISLYALTVPKLFERSLSEIKTLIQSFEFAGAEFQQVHAVFVNPTYTFVPDALFDANDAATYLKLIHSAHKVSSVHYERLQHTVTVYEVNDLFYNAIRLALPGVEFHHYSGMLAQVFGSMNQKKQNDRVYINFLDEGMDVFYYNGNALHYHNYFPFESDTDVVYFLLSVAETIQLSTDNWEVVVSGNITSESSLIGLMKKYIPRVLLLKRPEFMEYPSAFREFQDQQYYIELAGLACEL